MEIDTTQPDDGTDETYDLMERVEVAAIDFVAKECPPDGALLVAEGEFLASQPNVFFSIRLPGATLEEAKALAAALSKFQPELVARFWDNPEALFGVDYDPDLISDRFARKRRG